MDKYSYFYKAIKTPIFMDIQWLISLLSYTTYESEPVPSEYALKYEDDKAYYYDPQTQWTPLEGSYKLKGVFEYNEKINLPPNTLENAPKGVEETTVGRIILNKILLCYPFKDKIPYRNMRTMPSDIESIIKPLLKDNPPEGSPRTKDFIYLDEYLTFANSALFITQLTQVCVPGVSEKSIQAPPNAKEKMNELLEKYKGHLKDPVIISDIGREMEKLDEEYLKGDRSLGFLINKNKDLKVNRKKQYLMYGFDKSFDENADIEFIPKPLCDGLDYTKIDSYNNGSRLGSFSRGYETQLGGVAVKELLRASANCSIDIEDCNSTIGMEILLNDENIKKYLKFYIIEGNKSIQLTDENVSKYRNKVVTVRSPAFCKAEGTGYCARCVGPHLSLHEHGISNAVAEMGGVFLETFLKAMHGKVLSTKPLDFDSLIS